MLIRPSLEVMSGVQSAAIVTILGEQFPQTFLLSHYKETLDKNMHDRLKTTSLSSTRLPASAEL